MMMTVPMTLMEMVTMTSKESARFEAAKAKIIGNDRLRPTIGVLAEKTIHAVVKNYLEPDEDCQEIPVAGFVADIFRQTPHGPEILEIQTRAMYKMKRKLDAFLPQYPVTIVYPIPSKKMLIWVDEETGELSPPRKSPKKGTAYSAVRELYSIREYLNHPNLRIKLLLMEMEEYKLLNGRGASRKIHATRYDRIPGDLTGEMDLTCPEDYMQLIPADLPEEFTSADFAKAAHIRKDDAGHWLLLFRLLNVVEKIGQSGKSYLYRCREF